MSDVTTWPCIQTTCKISYGGYISILITYNTTYIHIYVCSPPNYYLDLFKKKCNVFSKLTGASPEQEYTEEIKKKVRFYARLKFNVHLTFSIQLTLGTIKNIND